MTNAKLLTVVCLGCVISITAIQASDKKIAPNGLGDLLFHQSVQKEIGVPPQSGTEIETGDCTDYIDLSGQPLPILVTGTTVGATNNYGPFPLYPPCWEGYWDAGSCAGPDKTYKWTVPADGRYTISLCGWAYYDTGLLLYNFTCPTEPSYPQDFIIGCDDYCGLRSQLSLELFANQQILIVVDGYGNNAGPYQLRILEYQAITNLDSLITATMSSEHVPGISACAIYNGNVIWSGNYGYANISQGVMPSDSTLFFMASVSKTVLGVALMQLWEQGLFDLDEDINPYLPWEVHNPFYPDSIISFRMLMSHTSAILDNMNIFYSLVSWGYDYPVPMEPILRNYLIPGGTYYYPGMNFGDYPPGTEYNYCNIATTLAGYLIERINPDSLSFEDYCQQYIFHPLEMNNTSWFLANLNVADIAIPYSWNGNSYVPYQHCGIAYYPAGQLRTSTSQMARLLIAMMQHGQIGGTRILDSVTVDMMTTIEAGGFYGLYWFQNLLGGRIMWGHDGGWYGSRTHMFFCPEENTGVIVLDNGENWVRNVVDQLFEYAAHYASIPELSDKSSIPERFTLYQNYPNPFNPVTNISYYLPHSSEIQVDIYNLLGQRVETLFNGRQEGGFHSVRWDASNSASGIYFVQLQSSNLRQTQKMLLLK